MNWQNESEMPSTASPNESALITMTEYHAEDTLVKPEIEQKESQ